MEKKRIPKGLKKLGILLGILIGAALLILFMLYFVFIHLYSHTRSYDEIWMMNKTSQEIEKRYGEFFYPRTSQRDSDGMIRNGQGCYCAESPPVSFNGNFVTCGTYIYIAFNSDGRAWEARIEKSAVFDYPFDMEWGSGYKEKHIIGKTAEEIQKKYGPFDSVNETTASYKTTEQYHPKMLVILFDQNGIATALYWSYGSGIGG